MNKEHWSREWMEDRFFNKYKLPQGEYDLKKPTKLTFKRWSFDKHKQWGGDIGTLKIESKPEADRIKLKVNWDTTQRMKETRQKCDAQISCKNDQLLTPMSWGFKSQCFDKNGSPLEYTKYTEQVRIRGNKLMKSSGKGVSSNLLGKNLTTNWGLFCSIPSLLENGIDRIKFDMMEDLTYHRKDQMIEPIGSSQFKIEDEKVELKGFKQIGNGILPTTYWLDANNRLIFVVTSVAFHFYLHQVS